MAVNQPIYGLDVIDMGKHAVPLFRDCASINFSLKITQFRDIVINTLKATYDAIVAADIEDARDYRSEKVVEPVNAAKYTIGSLLPMYYEILGCIEPNETDKVSITVYALAGGPTGLNLVMQIIGLRDVNYKYTYPEMTEKSIAEPGVPEDLEQVVVKTNTISFLAVGGGLESAEYDEETFDVVDSTGVKLTLKTSVGKYVVYHVHPMDGYTFSNIIIDGSGYNSIKTANDVKGLSIAEYTDGYEIALTETNDDHTIVFTCSRDVTINVYTINVVTVNCIASLYRDAKSVLADDEQNVLITGGDSFSSTFHPAICTNLASLIIDGKDYYPEYSDSSMIEFKGKTQDGEEFTIIVDSKGVVTFDIASVLANHQVTIAYEAVEYNIKGILVDKNMNIMEEEVFAVTRSFYSTKDPEVFNFGDYINEYYPEYYFEIMYVRDTGGKPCFDKVVYDINTDTKVLTYEKPRCDLVFMFKVLQKPQAFTITGHTTRANFISENGTYTDSIVSTNIPIKSTVGYLIQLDEDYALPKNMYEGFKITVDGNELLGPASYDTYGIVIKRVSHITFRVIFNNIDNDHVFSVEITDKAKVPQYEIVYEGINCNPEDSIDGSMFVKVKRHQDSSAIFFPNEGYVIPTIAGELDVSKIVLTVNGLVVNAEHYLSNVSCELVYIDERGGISMGWGETQGIRVSIANVTTPYMVYLKLTEDAIEIDCEVVFSGIHCTPIGADSNNKLVLTDVHIGDTVSAIFTPDEGYRIPTFYDGAIDYSNIYVIVNHMMIDITDSDIVQLEIVHPTGVLTIDSLKVTFPKLIGDMFETIVDGELIASKITVGLNDAGALIPEPEEVTHTVNVVMTHASSQQPLPVTVPDGADYTIVIDADPGTTFENVMFIMDTGNSKKSWVIDLDDRVNIFDKTIVGVPRIDNNGKIVRITNGDHYVYTIYLKNIQYDFEVRFSTFNLIIG